MALVKEDWVIRKTSTVSIPDALAYVRSKMDDKQEDSATDSNGNYIDYFFADLFDSRTNYLYRIYSTAAANSDVVIDGDADNGDAYFDVVNVDNVIAEIDSRDIYLRKSEADFPTRTEVEELIDDKIQENNHKLEISDISVNGDILSIFKGIEMTDGEYLYVVGDNGIILEEVYSDTLSVILSNNVMNEFVIVYDGTSASVYLRDDANKDHVTLALNEFPKNYDKIDTNQYTLSPVIETMLKGNYDERLLLFKYSGIISTMTSISNFFEALNSNAEALAIYDGSELRVYKNKKVDYQYLIDNLIIQ